MPTRQQSWAQKAYDVVRVKGSNPLKADYARVCKTFPALIHNSGLCQAVAFAESKDQGKGEEFGQYLDGLASILGMDSKQLSRRSRSDEVLAYQSLTHDALAVATWMKRFAEALLKDEAKDQGKEGHKTESSRGE